ncbi:MAG: HAD-IB family phosphatase [Candidatus Bathyarchaeia archaeon]
MNRRIRLVVFDLDGTLTPVDSLWSYLHEAFGTWDYGKLAAQKYRRGEISYKEWAETDSQYWAGAPLTQVMQVLEKIPYRKGAEQVFQDLKRGNVKTAIVSAGLSLLTDKAGRDLGADLTLSNELQTNDGRLTGGIVVKVGVNEKREIIERIAIQLKVPLAEVALVGDRANDLMNPECLKIAFKPKDENARQVADIIIEDDDLSKILPYLVQPTQ